MEVPADGIGRTARWPHLAPPALPPSSSEPSLPPPFFPGARPWLGLGGLACCSLSRVLRCCHRRPPPPRRSRARGPLPTRTRLALSFSTTPSQYRGTSSHACATMSAPKTATVAGSAPRGGANLLARGTVACWKSKETREKEKGKRKMEVFSRVNEDGSCGVGKEWRCMCPRVWLR
jgi:hypothetical protein